MCLCAAITVLLNASQRSRVGVGINRSVMGGGGKCKALLAVQLTALCKNVYFYFIFACQEMKTRHTAH